MTPYRFKTVLHLRQRSKVRPMSKRNVCPRCEGTGWAQSNEDPITVVPCSCPDGQLRSYAFEVKPERTPAEQEAMQHHPSNYGHQVIAEMKEKLK